MPPSPIKKSYTSRLSQDWPSCFVENESLNLFTTVTTFTEFVVYTVLLFIQSCCLHSPACPTKKDQIQDIFLKHKSFCIVIFGCLIIQFNLPMIGSTSIPCLIGWSVLVLAMLDSRTVSGLKSRILWRWAGTYFVLDNFLPISLEESTYN